MDRFADRFDPTRYADDESFGIGLASVPVDDWLFVPIPIFGRLLAIGAAYRLHVLGQLLARGEVAILNPPQCQSLLDELQWVASILSDPLVSAVIPEIEQRVGVCARSNDAHLVIDLQD